VLDTVPDGVAIRPILSAATAASILESVESSPWGVRAYVEGRPPALVTQDDDGSLRVTERIESVEDLERVVPKPGEEVTVAFEVQGPPPVVATGDERIVPPMRSIEAPASELANTHE
jgi:hypothetical protein